MKKMLFIYNPNAGTGVLKPKLADVIDILVNNAGIIKRIPMTEMSAAEFRQVVDIDLNAPFIMSKAVLPDMIERDTERSSISVP